MKTFLIGLCCLAAASPVARSQEKAPMTSGADEVLVDFVARDKHGKAVENLKESDITVTDDGKQQQIKSFRLIQGKDVVNSSGARAPLDATHQIRLLTFLFDRMDPGGARLARQAALDLLNEELPPNVFAGVFLLTDKMLALQEFTNDRPALRTAVEKATSGMYTDVATESATLRERAETLLGPNTSGLQSGQDRANYLLGSDANGNPAPADAGNPFGASLRVFAQMMVQMIDYDERTDMENTGRSNIGALLAAVRAEYELPGRKSILYFTKGFSVPQGWEDTFRLVISTANLNNVSFYPFDAHGLGVDNLNDQAQSKLAAAAMGSRDNTSSGSTEDLHRGSNAVRSMDTAIESGRYNTQDTLAILAQETGGFLTANTNDFRGPAHRIAEETSTYYEISYDPHIADYDGKFRKIGVKPVRPDLLIQSRSGYFALPRSMMTRGGAPDGYEFSLLRALSATTPVTAFPFESGGMHFRGDEHNELCGFLINVPLQNVTLRDDGKGGLTGGLSYVALVKDGSGAVAKKLQGEMPVKLTNDQVPGFHQAQFTDSEYFDVPPGHYTVEAAVLDRESGRTSVHKTTLLVPKQGDTLAMSSVALIRSWHGKEADTAADDPFVVGDKTVVPTLLPKFNKSVSESLPFYAVLYPDSRNPAKPEVTVEFLLNGKVARVGKPDVSAPDSEGRIQLVANTPIAELAPGDYAIRFKVKQGTELAEEQFALTLEP